MKYKQSTGIAPLVRLAGAAGIAFCLTWMTVTCRSTISIAEGFTLQSPYTFDDYQYKVQLHTHTTNSDGGDSPEFVLQEYAKRGYTAVAITDHDYSNRTTPSLDSPGEYGIIHIPGVEYSADQENRSWNHMLGLNIRTIHHEDGIYNRQAQINRSQAEKGLTFLCHPYDETIHRRGWSEGDIVALEGYDGLEIHNGGVYHEPGGPDFPYKVDMVLSSGVKINVISVDDYHRNPSENMDRGYVVINSRASRDAITLNDIVMALRTGNYFSVGRLSTTDPAGPLFTNIIIEAHTITANTDKPADIEFITARNNYYKEGPNYTFIEKRVTTASYTASDDDQFVRVKATYRENGRESYAWSNPIYIIKEDQK
jgi:hypothetical protein